LLFWDVAQYRRFGAAYSSHLSRVKFNLEDGTDRLSRNVGNYQSALRNIPEERRYQEPRRIFAILKTSDLTSVQTAAVFEATSRTLHSCGFWGSLRGVIEETGFLGCDAASRGVSRSFEGLCCLYLEGFSAPIPSPRTITLHRILMCAPLPVGALVRPPTVWRRGGCSD